MERNVALTLIQPWGTAIIHHGKDIENRTWEPYASQLRPGDRLWIHAGKKRDKGASEFIAGVCTWHDSEEAFEQMADRLDHAPLGALLGHVRFDGVTRSSDSPWFFGPVGWRLSDPVALPMLIFCRGAQGLWTVPDDVLGGK
jgi:hypothetical protein